MKINVLFVNQLLVNNQILWLLFTISLLIDFKLCRIMNDAQKKYNNIPFKIQFHYNFVNQKNHQILQINNTNHNQKLLYRS